MSATCARVRRTSVGCLQPNRSVVRAGLEHDRVAPGELLVHDHLILAAAEGRHGAELEVRVVAREVVLARQVHLLAADAEHGCDFAHVDPLGGREHGAHVAARRDQDERLRHLLGPDAERGGLVRRPLRVGVLEHVEIDPRLLEETRHVCHRSLLSRPSSQLSSARASRARRRALRSGSGVRAPEVESTTSAAGSGSRSPTSNCSSSCSRPGWSR